MKATIGFIRVRKRKTKDSKVASYDIVRAVRLNGKPTHRFVLGLGTLYHPRRGDMRFWMNAVDRMTKHGLSKQERKYFVQAISRKGVRLPTTAECKEYEGFTKGTCLWNQGSARKLRGVIALTED